MEDMVKLKSKVKSNLDAILRDRGLRYNWVAEKIGATQAQITNWCKNRDGYARSTPSVVYILRLQRLLEVKVEEMFEEIEEERNDRL